MTRLLITTGPESAGKTTLANQLSDLLQAPLVTEMAREYLTAELRRDASYRYRQSDLLAIAQLHQQQEQALLNHAPDFIICDTDLVVLRVWSEVKYGACDPWISHALRTAVQTTSRTYLLCDPHVPWEPDPLRENPLDRDVLFALYRQTLLTLDAGCLTVTGTEQERMRQVEHYLAAQTTTHLPAYDSQQGYSLTDRRRTT